MEMKLISDTQDDLAFVFGTSASLRTLPEAQLSTVSGDFGNIQVQQIQAGRFTIYYSRYHIKRNCSFYFAMEEPSLELHIMEGNSMAYDLSGLGKVTTREHEFNITYLPYIENRTSFKPGNYSTFDVHFDRSALAEYCALHPLIDAFLHHTEKQQARQYSSGRQKASPEIIGIIRQLLFNPFSAPVLYSYLESKAVELLLVCLRQLSVGTERGIKFRQDDIDRIHAAAALITEDLHTDYSLTQLARLVGTNDYKLKTVFKHVFGTSVFAYRMNYKVQQGRFLLHETNRPISDIAFEIGFKNPPNFNEAFKKQFGCTPTHMRKAGKPFRPT